MKQTADFTHIAGSVFVNVTPPPQGPPLRNDAWERIVERMVADIDAGIEPFGLRFRDDSTKQRVMVRYRQRKAERQANPDSIRKGVR